MISSAADPWVDGGAGAGRARVVHIGLAFLCPRMTQPLLTPRRHANRALAFELESFVDRSQGRRQSGRVCILHLRKLPTTATAPFAACNLLHVTAAAIMRIFGRKGSKPVVSPTGSQPNSSNGSLRSPGPTPNGSRPTSFPDVPLPRAPDPALDPAGYLRSIYAVRERSKLVLEKAKKNQLKHFTVDMSKFHDVASFVVSIIKVSNGTRTALTLRAGDAADALAARLLT
jgi:hypothetical protein